jgi:U4/U6.U5 tri-snRNP-associated protein 2
MDFITNTKLRNKIICKFSLYNFSFLTLDLPKPPLFKKDNEKINIPQVSIYELFKKYNGKTITEDPIKGTKRIYHILKLPQNLILCFKRFEKNQYFTEKNNTIVNFPIKNLSLDEILPESENKYDLLSNVIHDGKPDEGTFRVQAKSKALDQWYEIQDLNIRHIMGQSVILSESYIHAYECKK